MTALLVFSRPGYGLRTAFSRSQILGAGFGVWGASRSWLDMVRFQGRGSCVARVLLVGSVCLPGPRDRATKRTSPGLARAGASAVGVHEAEVKGRGVCHGGH